MIENLFLFLILGIVILCSIKIIWDYIHLARPNDRVYISEDDIDLFDINMFNRKHK